MPSFAEWGFEPARPDEDAHTQRPLAGINQGAATDRISAAVADHYEGVDAQNVAIQVPGRWRWQRCRASIRAAAFADVQRHLGLKLP